MAPHGDAVATARSFSRTKALTKPPRLSKKSLQRTVSDISFELSKEKIEEALPAISEVEDAKCECCGMSEECTPEYVERVRSKFLGRWICGLCSEAVKAEVEKNGGNMEGALVVHMSACAKFKRLRSNPAMVQAEAMRDILKKGTARAKSISPRDRGSAAPRMGGISRSSSCIAAITRNMSQLGISD